MKKLLLSVLLLTVVFGVSAHPNHIYGVRVGMNIANMTFKQGGISATQFGGASFGGFLL